MTISTFCVSGENPHSSRDLACPTSHRPSLSPLPRAEAGKAGHTMPPSPRASFPHTVYSNGKVAKCWALKNTPPNPRQAALPRRPSWWATAGAPCASASRNVYFASAGLQGNYREPNPQPRKSDFIRTPKGHTSGPWADRRHHGGEFHTVARVSET